MNVGRRDGNLLKKSSYLGTGGWVAATLGNERERFERCSSALM